MVELQRPWNLLVWPGVEAAQHDGAGNLGTRYYLSAGNLISGYSGSLAVSPETGDIVVILASNSRLPAWEFVHQTVSEWAPEAE